MACQLAHNTAKKLILRGLDLDLVKTENGWDIPKIIGMTGALLDRTGQDGKIAQILTMRKIGIDVDSMTLSDATGTLPKVRFSNLYFDFESLTNGSLVGSIRGRHDTSVTVLVILLQLSPTGPGQSICC